VLGVDILRSKDVRATHRLIVDHIARVRKLPMLAHATCVLLLESNLAFESQHILHYISEQNVPKWVALAEGAGGALGWLTVR
jgi:hypothetical protein